MSAPGRFHSSWSPGSADPYEARELALAALGATLDECRALRYHSGDPRADLREHRGRRISAAMLEISAGALAAVICQHAATPLSPPPPPPPIATLPPNSLVEGPRCPCGGLVAATDCRFDRPKVVQAVCLRCGASWAGAAREYTTSWATDSDRGYSSGVAYHVPYVLNPDPAAVAAAEAREAAADAAWTAWLAEARQHPAVRAVLDAPAEVSTRALEGIVEACQLHPREWPGMLARIVGAACE